MRRRDLAEGLDASGTATADARWTASTWRCRRARVCGLLGPNGAGKTTAVRILDHAAAGRRRPGPGRRLRRRPPARPGARASIGLVGQHAAVDEILSGRQNLVMFGRLYHLGRPAARGPRRRAAGPVRPGRHRRPSRSRQYSGGMRRRLDLAASLILTPPVLFLDEPTTGLDPRGRTEVWDAVRGLVAGGTTVLLTTQYLDEADQLADRISVIDHGRVIADGHAGRAQGRDRRRPGRRRACTTPADLAAATRAGPAWPSAAGRRSTPTGAGSARRSPTGWRR